MALTLRDAQGLTLTDEAAELASPQDRQALRNIAIGGTSQFGRGWELAGLGERANELFTQAAQMYNSGRVQEGDVLKAQAQDFQQQASQWAPTVQSARDVNSLSSAADWTLGAAGNVRSSVRPALGGLAGAAIGAAAAPLTGGLINPLTGAKIGGTIGAAWPTFNMEKQEAATLSFAPGLRVRLRSSPNSWLMLSRICINAPSCPWACADCCWPGSSFPVPSDGNAKCPPA